jgi:hypothetical protein
MVKYDKCCYLLADHLISLPINLQVTSWFTQAARYAAPLGITNGIA